MEKNQALHNLLNGTASEEEARLKLQVRLNHRIEFVEKIGG